ncbi:33210_t:CDS:1, partial [Racocetra persica]
TILKGYLMRWVLALQSFEFKMHYKLGIKHRNANSMFRLSDSPINEVKNDKEFVDLFIIYVMPENVKLTDLEVISGYLKNFTWTIDVTSMDLKHLRRK